MSHLSPLYMLSTFINHGPPLSTTGQYTCTCSVYSTTRDGVESVEWIWPLTADQVHTQTCGLHVSQVIVCSYVTNGLPWWQECMQRWGVEGVVVVNRSNWDYTTTTRQADKRVIMYVDIQTDRYYAGRHMGLQVIRHNLGRETYMQTNIMQIYI